jgi:hypothetical protein
MRPRQVFGAFVLLLAIVTSPDWAGAQTTYRPSSPTFSPWLNLYQRNSGPLDPYHTMVLPRFQLRNTLQQQASEIDLNSSMINTNGQQLSQIQEQGGVEPTGTGSVFMQYSHYYPSGPNGARVGLAATARRNIGSVSISGGQHSSMPNLNAYQHPTAGLTH